MIKKGKEIFEIRVLSDWLGQCLHFLFQCGYFNNLLTLTNLDKSYNIPWFAGGQNPDENGNEEKFFLQWYFCDAIVRIFH